MSPLTPWHCYRLPSAVTKISSVLSEEILPMPRTSRLVCGGNCLDFSRAICLHQYFGVRSFAVNRAEWIEGERHGMV